MLNVDTLSDELGRLLGDHTEIECEIDNVQAYLDGVAARRKIAPYVGECGWLILLGLYRAGHASEEGMTIAQACTVSSHPAATAIPHIKALLNDGYVRHVDAAPAAAQRRLVLTPRGSKAVAGWMALMHLGARTPIAITTDAIVAALKLLVDRSGAVGAP
jgi:hypothetical protein